MTAHPKAARARARDGRRFYAPVMPDSHTTAISLFWTREMMFTHPVRVLNASPGAKKRRENRVASAIATSRALKRSVRDAARAVLRAAGL